MLLRHITVGEDGVRLWVPNTAHDTERSIRRDVNRRFAKLPDLAKKEKGIAALLHGEARARARLKRTGAVFSACQTIRQSDSPFKSERMRLVDPSGS